MNESVLLLVSTVLVVGELEVARVIHEARATSAVVLTYDPDRYAGHRIDVVDLRCPSIQHRSADQQ